MIWKPIRKDMQHEGLWVWLWLLPTGAGLFLNVCWIQGHTIWVCVSVCVCYPCSLPSQTFPLPVKLLLLLHPSHLPSSSLLLSLQPSFLLPSTLGDVSRAFYSSPRHLSLHSVTPSHGPSHWPFNDVFTAALPLAPTRCAPWTSTEKPSRRVAPLRGGAAWRVARPTLHYPRAVWDACFWNEGGVCCAVNAAAQQLEQQSARPSARRRRWVRFSCSDQHMFSSDFSGILKWTPDGSELDLKSFLE